MRECYAGRVAEPTPAADLTEYALFEGLFVRTYQPTGAFAADLKAAGFDLTESKARYPTPVFRECLLIARRHLYADRTEAAGLRRMGEEFIEGYLHTIVGSVLGAGLALLPIETVVRRVPKNIAVNSSGVRGTCEATGPHDYRLTFADRYALPEFYAGTISALLHHKSESVTVTVTAAGPGGCELRVTW